MGMKKNVSAGITPQQASEEPATSSTTPEAMPKMAYGPAPAPASAASVLADPELERERARQAQLARGLDKQFGGFTRLWLLN